MKRFLKIISILLLSAFLLLAIAAVCVKIFFPAERVRLLAEKKLGEILHDEVEIGRLSFSLLTGFEARRISIGGEGAPLRVARVFLLYDLSQLLRGKLLISKIEIDHPAIFFEKKGGKWDFEKYMKLRISYDKFKILIPTLPVPVDLRSFEISDLTLRLKDRNWEMEWKGLNIVASMSASLRGIKINMKISHDAKTGPISSITAGYYPPFAPVNGSRVLLSATPEFSFRVSADDLELIKLDGDFALNDILLTRGKDSVSTRAGVKIDINLYPIIGAVDINRVALDLFSGLLASLHGRISGIYFKPSFDLDMDSAQISLTSLARFIRPLYPELTTSGIVRINKLNLRGSLEEKGTAWVSSNGAATMEEICIDDERQDAAITNLNGVFSWEDARADSTGAASGSFATNLDIKRGDIKKIRFRGLTLNLPNGVFNIKKGRPQELRGTLSTLLRKISTGPGNAEGIKTKTEFSITRENLGHIRTSGTVGSVTLSLPDRASIQTPVSMDIEADFGVAEFKNIKLKGNVDLPGLLLKAGGIKQSVDISLTPDISINLEEKKITLRELKIVLPGQSTVNIKGKYLHGDSPTAEMAVQGAVSLAPFAPAFAAFVPGLDIAGTVALDKSLLTVKAGPHWRRFTAKGSGKAILQGIDSSYRKDFMNGLSGPITWKISGLDQEGIHNARAKITGRVSFSGARLKDLSINEAETRFSAWSKGSEALGAEFDFNARDALLILPQGKLSMPLNARGKVEGNLNTGRLTVKSLDWGDGRAVSGSTTATLERSDAMGFELNNRLSLDMGKAMNLFKPADSLQWLGNIKVSGIFADKTRVKGRLNKTGAVKMVIDSESNLTDAVLAIPSKGWRSPSTDLKASVRMESDMVKGLHDIKKLTCEIKDLMSAKVEGQFQEEKNIFNARIELDELNLNNFVNYLPPGTPEKIRELKTRGKINVTIETEGTLPGQDALKRFPRTPLPISVKCGVKLERVFFSWPPEDLEAEGISGPLTLLYGRDGFHALSDIKIDKVTYPKAYPESFPMSAATDIRSDLTDRLTVNELIVRVPRLGFEESVNGYLKGIGPFLFEETRPTLKNILSTAEIKLNHIISFKSDLPVTLLGDARVKGEAVHKIFLGLFPRDKIIVEGMADFHGFSLKYGDIALMDHLSGFLPFKRKLLLKFKDESQGGSKTGAASVSGLLSNRFLPYRPKKERLTIGSISAMGHEISNLELEPLIEDDSISLERFSFKALGGYVVGHLRLGGARGERGLKLGLEFAGIDSGRLVDDVAGGKSTVNGNVRLEMPLLGSGAPEALDLGMVDLEVNITKIGEKVLDRFLLFLDRRESNPAIVDLRSKLKLAVPVESRVKLRHGALSVFTRLKLLAAGGGTIDINAPERVPIARISGFGDIEDALENARTISGLINLLFSTTLELKGEGAQLR